MTTSSIRTDRRSITFRTAVNSIYRNRRAACRRSTDIAANVYFDRHEPWMAFLVLGIVLLSIADAYYTLNILERGGEELGPFVAYLIQQGELIFYSVKFTITAFGVLVVLMHKNFVIFKYFSGYHGLYLILLSYVVLIIYELILLGIMNYFPGFPVN